MDIFAEYANLVASDAFQEFRKSYSDFYLVHAYLMSGKDESTSPEFGFYSESKDRIVVFETNPVRKRDEEEVFKKDGIILPLSLDKVMITMEQALDIAEKTCREKYPTEIIQKKIILLQNIKSQVWNITFISLSFNIINIKIDSEFGNVTDFSIHSIMNLGTRI